MASRHSPEFRAEAVQLASSSGLGRKRVADDLGIGFSTLTAGFRRISVVQTNRRGRVSWNAR